MNYTFHNIWICLNKIKIFAA